MFNVNIDHLIEMLLSPRLLMSSFVVLLQSLIDPIKSLIASLNDYRIYTFNKLDYNGQVCSLERLLNYRFAPVDGDIFITDADSISMLVAYPADDSLHHIIVSTSANFADYSLIAYRNELIGNNFHRFLVHIPDSNEIRVRENELKATVQQYKLAGKGFILRYY